MASPEEIRQLFFAEGWSVAAWAREHGFPPSLVYRVLRGETLCVRGTTHAIGIALGIKSPSSEALRQILPSDHTVAPDSTSHQTTSTALISANHTHADVRSSLVEGG